MQPVGTSTCPTSQPSTQTRDYSHSSAPWYALYCHKQVGDGSLSPSLPPLSLSFLPPSLPISLSLSLSLLCWSRTVINTWVSWWKLIHFSFLIVYHYTGQQRSKQLATLFKDERCQQLPAFNILEKMLAKNATTLTENFHKIFIFMIIVSGIWSVLFG